MSIDDLNERRHHLVRKRGNQFKNMERKKQQGIIQTF